MSRAPSFRARFEAMVAGLRAQVCAAPVLLRGGDDAEVPVQRARGGEHA